MKTLVVTHDIDLFKRYVRGLSYKQPVDINDFRMIYRPEHVRGRRNMAVVCLYGYDRTPLFKDESAWWYLTNRVVNKDGVQYVEV